MKNTLLVGATWVGRAAVWLGGVAAAVVCVTPVEALSSSFVPPPHPVHINHADCSRLTLLTE